MKSNVVRAWKDATYRKNLSRAELATLPLCPAGDFELTDADLDAVHGGWDQGCQHERECCSEENNVYMSSYTSDANALIGGGSPCRTQGGALPILSPATCAFGGL